MINRRVAALLVLIAPLAACVTGSDSTTPSPNPNATFTARFEPLGGIMPFPNDLYFNGSTTGTLNIPGSATVTQNAPLLALNHLDGYGTESDINIYFTQPVDATTLTPSNVFVFKVSSSPTNKAVDPTQGAALLSAGTDYSIGVSPGVGDVAVPGSIVTIKPLKPLAPSTVSGTTAKTSTYLVVVTTGVKNSTGTAVAPSSDFSTIVAADGPAIAALDVTKINLAATDPLLPVAQFTFPQLLVAAGAKIPLANVAVTFSFSTAYLDQTLAQLSKSATATAQPSGVGIVDTHETVCDVLHASGQLPTAAPCSTVPGSDFTEVFAGTVALPYYLAVPTASNPTAALTASWHNAKGGDTALSFNATGVDTTAFDPKATVPLNVIPILVAAPKAGGPCTNASPWPTVIFQHGITRNREDMLGIASTLVLAGAPTFCMAVVAIDLPLHGVTNTKDPFYVKGHERTFDMDLENNTTLAAGPDGTIDSSGAWFINLTSTITSRDNLREGAADLINLAATVPTLSAGSNAFNGSALFFVGHSLGGIVGIDFLGADTDGHALGGPLRILGAVVANPGGHIAELLQNSATFAPIINGQLAANGIVKGSQSYLDFYSEAQAVAEGGDPANFASAAVAGHLTHMLEVVGGLDAGSPPDQVVPNSATDVLIGQMGITTPVSSLTPNAIGLGAPTLAQFISGDHGSVLSPAAPTGAAPADQVAYGKVTVEMQTEIIKLFGSIAAATPATIVTDNTYLSTTLKK